MMASITRWRTVAVLLGAAALASVAVFVGTGAAGTSGAPVNQSLPVPVGSFQDGGQLQALPLNGRWTNNPTGFAYQWYRVNPVGGVATPISGATSSSYSPVQADVDAGRILVQVSATNASGAAAASSESVPLFEDAPDNTAAPVIQGATTGLVVGQALTVTQGTWTGSPTSFTYQWYRCNASGANCAPIAGATTNAYTTVQADQGNTLRALVEATTSGPTTVGRAVTSATAVVGGPGPQNSARPTISGTAVLGQTLTAGNGTWTSPNGSPIMYAYQWQRCNVQGQQCVNIPGATQQTYVLQQADLGSTIVVVVTATNNQGSQSASSNPTGVVGGVPSGSVIPASQVTLASGNKLSIQSVDYTPNVLRSRAPFTLRVRIGDVQNHFVSGAQVSLVAVPFGRIAAAPTLTSDSQGYATFTLSPTSKFPLKKGFRITIFVRAIVPGTNVIEGPTALRLTSVGINPNV
jgi:hypothetical protein